MNEQQPQVQAPGTAEDPGFTNEEIQAADAVEVREAEAAMTRYRAERAVVLGIKLQRAENQIAELQRLLQEAKTAPGT